VKLYVLDRDRDHVRFIIQREFSVPGVGSHAAAAKHVHGGGARFLVVFGPPRRFRNFLNAERLCAGLRSIGEDAIARGERLAWIVHASGVVTARVSTLKRSLERRSNGQRDPRGSSARPEPASRFVVS
jgi:hypothetical protein